MGQISRSVRVAITTVSVVFAAASWAGAQTAPAPVAVPVTIKEVQGQLGASINNAGLQQSFDASWRRKLSASANPLLSEAHVSAGGWTGVTPASLRAGAWVEIAPVSFFVLRAGVDPAQYFGNFDSVTSFDNRLEAFDSDARKARANAKAGRTTKFYVTPTLQLRAGHFAGQSSLDLEHWSSTAAGPLFYEPTRDTVLEVSGDHLATLSTVVLYEHEQRSGGKFSIGPMHSLMRVHSSDVNRVQRAGVVMIQQMTGRHFGLSNPRATVMLARYLDDASKRGQWSAAIAVGFALKRR